MALSIRDLKQVRRLLHSISRKWYDIGIELELTSDQLLTIKANNDRVEDCLREMLEVWLRTIDPPPTWTALGDALKAEPVNEMAKAELGMYMPVHLVQH